jgi:hypothetical protein
VSAICDDIPRPHLCGLKPPTPKICDILTSRSVTALNLTKGTHENSVALFKVKLCLSTCDYLQASHRGGTGLISEVGPLRFVVDKVTLG